MKETIKYIIDFLLNGSQPDYENKLAKIKVIIGGEEAGVEAEERTKDEEWLYLPFFKLNARGSEYIEKCIEEGSTVKLLFKLNTSALSFRNNYIFMLRVPFSKGINNIFIRKETNVHIGSVSVSTGEVLGYAEKIKSAMESHFKGAKFEIMFL